MMNGETVGKFYAAFTVMAINANKMYGSMYGNRFVCLRAKNDEQSHGGAWYIAGAIKCCLCCENSPLPETMI